eukprot:g31973.t1
MTGSSLIIASLTEAGHGMTWQADQGKSMLVEASRDRSRQIKGDQSRSLLIEAEHGYHLIKAKLMADDG